MHNKAKKMYYKITQKKKVKRKILSLQKNSKMTKYRNKIFKR